MKTTAHGSNLLRLTRLGAVNAFLVREDDGLTLVDTGLPGSANGILVAADEAGAPIVRIALTHAHGDHVGSVAALSGDGRGDSRGDALIRARRDGSFRPCPTRSRPPAARMHRTPNYWEEGTWKQPAPSLATATAAQSSIARRFRPTSSSS